MDKDTQAKIESHCRDCSAYQKGQECLGKDEWQDNEGYHKSYWCIHGHFDGIEEKRPKAEAVI